MTAGCDNRQVGVTVYPDTRPHAMQEREGPRPETRAGLPDGTGRAVRQPCHPDRCPIPEAADRRPVVRSPCRWRMGRPR
jgi:hypothetical protein